MEALPHGAAQPCRWCERHGPDGALGADRRSRRCPHCRRRRQQLVALHEAGHPIAAIAALTGLTTTEVERAIQRERHIAELETLATDTVPSRPIRDAIDDWINAAPDSRSLRELARKLDLDAGYLSRLIGQSRMQDTEVQGQRVRGRYRHEMGVEDAKRIVRAIGLAPVELREWGL